MQSAIQSLFVAKDSYQDMPHQVYPRLANYEDGHYSYGRKECLTITESFIC